MALDDTTLFNPILKHPSGLCGEETIARSLTLCTGTNRVDKSARSELIGIAGAGLMGISIAATFLNAGYSVLLYDVAEGPLRTAQERLQKELALQNVSPESLEAIAAHMKTTQSLDELATCPVLIETIVEKLKIKQKFYGTLDPLVHNKMVLLSNTSTIEIGRLAAALDTCRNLSPERFCGFHFFHPVRRRSLLEIIRGQGTANATVEKAQHLARSIDKLPITVHDGPGFLVNRLLNPCLNEALVLLEEGYSPLQIDNVCKKFGMEMGPFRIMDEIGLDVALHSGWSIATRFPEHVTARTILPLMVRCERFGRKRGYGFYRYEGTTTFWEDENIIDNSFEIFLKENNISRPVPVDSGKKIEREIATRILLSIFLEAGRIVEDGIVDCFEAIDVALTCGLGFSKERGGICYWADCIGLDALLTEAKNYFSLGPRYAIPEIFKQYIQEKRTLITTDKMP